MHQVSTNGGYVNSFKEAKYLFVSIKNDQLLKKYNRTWDKISDIIEKAVHNYPVIKERKTKIKSKN